MGDLSKHFSAHELACKGKNCCGNTCAMNPKAIEALEEFRELVGVPFSPNSAFRCNRHNERIQGSKNSQHTKGFAIDIPLLEGFTIDRMAVAAESIPAFLNGGIGKYPTFLHIDVRNGKSRWDKR